MPGGPMEWWEANPPVTKHLLATAALLTALSSFQIFHPYRFLLLWEKVIPEFWRVGTCFLYFGALRAQEAIGTVMNFLVFANFSKMCEAQVFRNSLTDFLFCLAIIVAFCLVASVILEMVFLSGCLTMALTWVYCARNQGQIFSVFGFMVEASYFPFVMTGISYLLSQGHGLQEHLLGIAAGFCYIAFIDRAPQWLLEKIAPCVARGPVAMERRVEIMREQMEEQNQAADRQYFAQEIDVEDELAEARRHQAMAAARARMQRMQDDANAQRVPQNWGMGSQAAQAQPLGNDNAAGLHQRAVPAAAAAGGGGGGGGEGGQQPQGHQWGEGRRLA